MIYVSLYVFIEFFRAFINFLLKARKKRSYYTFDLTKYKRCRIFLKFNILDVGGGSISRLESGGKV